jgi:hypothetical protein
MVRTRVALIFASIVALGAPAFADTARKAPDDLSLIPVDSEIVGGLDVAGLMKSGLWKQYIEPQMQKADVQAKMNEFKNMCGIDPTKALTSVSFGVKNVQSAPEGVVIAHGVQKTKLLACFDKQKSMKKGDVEMTRDGDTIFIKDKTGQPFALQFTDENTAVMAFGPNATKAGMAKYVAGGSPLKTSKAFMEMYGKLNTGDTLWALVNGQGKLLDNFAAIGAKPTAAFGTLNVANDLTMSIRLRLASPTEAKNLAGAMQMQAKQALMFLDKFDVGNDGSDLTVGVAISDVKLKALAKQFGGAFGKAKGP